MKATLDRRAPRCLAAALPLLMLVPQVSRVGEDGPRPSAQEARQREQATPVWTDHLKLTAFASAATLAPGDRMALVVEIEPGEGMHVYAPGADSYRVITMTMAAQPFVRMLPMEYPPSEIYVFVPLRERIPVYQKPFALRQEFELERRPEAQAAMRGKPSLTLKGALEYQACDDTVCFNPVTVPLSWTLPLGPGLQK
jgi:hypothetical protein